MCRTTHGLSQYRASCRCFIISGDADPVGRWGEGVKVVYENLCEAGVSNVTLKLYPGARHELLNEQNRGEVFDDVLAFFEKHI